MTIEPAEHGIQQDETDLWTLRRQVGRGGFPMLQEMWVERGTRSDWDLLHGLHYKMDSTPVGAKYWRVRFRGDTIAVIAFGMSRPLLKERHSIFPSLKPGHDTQLTNIHRYRFINDNFRVIGRLVVDTLFRSSGVAYRFANLACRQYGYTYLEIQSSMSRYNFFAQRAGFTFVKPLSSLYHDKGLMCMRKYFAAHPGDQEALMEEYRLMSPAMQTKVERELKAFYFATSPLEKTGSRRFYAEGVVENWDIRRIISKIQGLCFTSPLYGIYKNPDAPLVQTRAQRCEENLPISLLPKRLPLLAFDLQRPDQPLDVGGLDRVAGWTELSRLIDERDWSRPTVLPPGFLAAEDDADELAELAEMAEVLDHESKLAVTPTSSHGSAPTS